MLRIQLKRALLLCVGLYCFAWGSIALRRTLKGLKSKNMHQKCPLSEHLQFSSRSPPNTFLKYMGRVQSCTAWSPLSSYVSSLLIGIHSIVGAIRSRGAVSQRTVWKRALLRRVEFYYGTLCYGKHSIHLQCTHIGYFWIQRYFP